MQITSSKASSMPFSLFIFSLLFSLHCTLTTCIIYSLSCLNHFCIKYTYEFSLSLSLSLSSSVYPLLSVSEESAVFCLLCLSAAALMAGDYVTSRPETAEILISHHPLSSTEFKKEKGKTKIQTRTREKG